MIRKVAVKDKNGVIQVAELGGRNADARATELKEIQINNSSQFVFRTEKTLGWDDVKELTINTGIAPTADEEKMFLAPDGTFMDRIVYEGYISKTVAQTAATVARIKVIATEETSKVTIYGNAAQIKWQAQDKAWKPTTELHQVQSGYMMTKPTSEIFGTAVRDGMDDMKVALDTDDRYTAQQRVYIDVEGPGGEKAYYVLVIYNARDNNRNVGRYRYPSGYPQYIDGRPSRANVFATPELYGPGESFSKTAGFSYAIWVYPAYEDLRICGPNAKVSVWSDDDQETMTADQKNTIAKYGTTDEQGNPYPLAFTVKVPVCDDIVVKMMTEDPLAGIGYGGISIINNYTTATISTPTSGFTPGQDIHLYGGTRSQLEMITGANAGQRRFDLYVEFYVPKSLKAALTALGVTMAQEEEGTA